MGVQAHGPASDGTHGSNVSAILKSLASDSAKAAEAEKYGFSKYVAELSLEELMAANLSGVPHALCVLASSAIRCFPLISPKFQRVCISTRSCCSFC